MAKMVLELQSDQPNKMSLTMDKFSVDADLVGGPNDQTIVFSIEDFKNREGESPSS